MSIDPRLETVKQALIAAVDSIWGEKASEKVVIIEGAMKLPHYSDHSVILNDRNMWFIFIMHDRLVGQYITDLRVNTILVQTDQSDCEFVAQFTVAIINSIVDDAMVNFIGG